MQTCKTAEWSLCHMFVNAKFAAKPKVSSATLLRLRLTRALFCNSPAAAAETGGQSVHDPSDRCQYRRQHVYNSDPHKAQPLMCSRWAIDGMLSPCIQAVGDISAPVAQKRMFLSSPFPSFFSRYEQRTDAEHPQPEPPE